MANTLFLWKVHCSWEMSSKEKTYGPLCFSGREWLTLALSFLKIASRLCGPEFPLSLTHHNCIDHNWAATWGHDSIYQPLRGVLCSPEASGHLCLGISFPSALQFGFARPLLVRGDSLSSIQLTHTIRDWMRCLSSKAIHSSYSML